MIYTVSIGDTLINNVASISRVEVLDSTLDYASILLNRELSVTAKSMKEVVTITVNDNSEIRSYYFMLDSDISNFVDKDNRTYSTHELSLVELTSRLGDYTTGYRKFTDNTKTLYTILSNLINTLYFKKTVGPDDSRVIGIDLTHESLDILKVGNSRDFQFDNLTLLEAISDIFKERGGIPRLILEDNVYKLTLDLENKRNTLRDIFEDVGEKPEYKETMNIDKYATTFESYTSNLVFDKTLEGASVVEPSAKGFMPVTTETEVFNSDNAIWRTKYNIRQIIKVELEVLNASGGLEVLDITPRVVPLEVFKGLDVTNAFNVIIGATTLNVEPTVGTYNPSTGVTYTEGTQRGSLYFQDNLIKNIYTEVPGLFAFPVIENVIESAFWDTFGDPDAGTKFRPFNANPSNSDVEQLRIRVTYVPIYDGVLHVEKYNIDTVNKFTTMQTNQSGSVVSTEKALKALGTEINAYGNKEVMTTAKLNLLANEWNIGDYTAEGLVISKKEVFYFNDFFEVRYQWDEDYQKRNNDLSVDSAIRYYSVPSRGVSDRVLIYKEYAYIGFTGLTSETTLLNFRARETFTNLIEKSATYNKSIQNALVTNEDVLTVTEPILMSVISVGGRNALNFNFGFDNPLVAGERLDTTSQSIPILEPINYADLDGEVEDINWALYDTSEVTDYKELPLIPLTDADNLMVGSIADKFSVKKDSAESIQFSYQLHLIPNDNIIIGDYFVSRNNLIEDRTTFENLEVYASTEFYSENETSFAKGVKQTGVTVSRLSNEIIKISSEINNASWAICTPTKELLFAVNQVTANQDTINIQYFNSRPDVDYRLFDEVIVDPPNAPTNLLASASSDTEIDLSWTDNSTDETYFLIRMSKDDETNYSTLDTVGFNQTTYTATGLEPSTLYFFQVLSYNQGGTTGVSADANEFTNATPQRPSTPTNYVVVSNSTTTLDATWDDVANELTYTIEWKRSTDTVWQTANLGAGATSYQITGLQSSTLYNTRIKANNLEGSSGYATFNQTTQTSVTQTAEPTISGVSKTSTSITFTVTNEDDDTATIRVDYNDSTPDRDSDSVISGGSTQFTFTGLQANTTYTIYATAQASGESVSTADSQSVTTDPVPQKPNAPSNFTGITDVLAIDFNWTDNSSDEDNFVIEIHGNSSFTNLIDSSTRPANSTSYLFSIGGGTYWARIKAVNGNGSSSWVSCNNNPITV